MGGQHSGRDRGAPVPLAVKPRTHRTKETTNSSECRVNKNNNTDQVPPPSSPVVFYVLNAWCGPRGVGRGAGEAA